MKKTTTIAIIAFLIVPTLVWAEENTSNPNEDLLLVSAIFTGNPALMTAAIEEVETEEVDRLKWLKVSSWLSWSGSSQSYTEVEGGVSATRLRVDADLWRGFSATVEHDFSAHVNGSKLRWPLEEGLQKAQIQWSRRLPKGGNLTLVGGQFLSAIAFLYPSPADLSTTRYPITLNGHSVYDRGIGAWLEGDFATFRINYDTEDERVATSLSAGPVSLFWDNRSGHGLLVEHSLNRWINLEVGFDRHEIHLDTNQRKHEYRAFVENHIDLTDQLSLYTGWDGNFKEGENEYCAGLSWQYRPSSFIKLFWHEEESGGEVAGQVTYRHSFNF